MTVSHFEKISRFIASSVGTLAVMSATTLFSLPAGAQMPTSSQAMPEPNTEISPERQRAHSLFRSLTGTLIPIDDARLKEMETLLQAGQDREATKVATRDPLFIDIRVRDMARKMSVRDESVRAPLNDFVATFAGIVRDSDTTSAKEMLTGNFTYRANGSIVNVGANTLVRSNVLPDIVNSNNHYLDIQTRGFSLNAVLTRVNGQVYNNNNTATALPDPAGLLSTRGWLEAHAIAGTNRRLVEYAFKEFMCQPMTTWADATAPDDRVARDVPRNPAGSNEKYLTTCKACHAQMDGLRGAFGRVDFTTRVVYTPAAIPAKMNRNDQEFPAGYITTDDSWVNYATVGKNADAFGWRSATTGSGMAGFGAMLANSRGFSRCMVRRVFTEVCKKSPSPTEESMVRSVADQFESSGYHMKGLFELVALRPECGVNVAQ